MTMEGGLVEQRRENIVGGLVSSKVIKKKKKNVRRRIMKSELPICVVLQELYISCRTVFKGPGVVPPAHDVLALCRILDRMAPEDVGLSRDIRFFNPSKSAMELPRVASTTIYKCQNFSLVLFFLPASAVIPLHNHPEMTVFSKLLLGTMHIKAYDFVDSEDMEHCKQSSALRLARLKANREFTAPCRTSVLYPTTGGNIHAFTAKTPCVVLDVMGPPYSKEDGRDCTYYKDIPHRIISDGDRTEMKVEESVYGWLEEIEMPEEARMNGIEYLGPQIIEHVP